MSVRNLERMFAPRSVALIGASGKERSIGGLAARNLIAGGFKGPLWLVNPKHSELYGQAVFPSVEALPEAPDLAVIATPPATVPSLIADLARRGAGAAVVITAFPPRQTGAAGDLKQAMLDAARPALLRILGPNCIGLLVPGVGLNASFAHTDACRRTRLRVAIGRAGHRACSTGPSRAASASPISSRWATWPTSISATCSTTSPATRERGRSCSTSRRSRHARKFMSAARARRATSR